MNPTQSPSPAPTASAPLPRGASEPGAGPAQAAEIRAGNHSSNSDTPDKDEQPEVAVEFVPERCLFCNQDSPSFEKNITHMHQVHGLFIPDGGRLVVDLETLVRYLHLVIFGYFECLACGTRRSSALAVQQHMMGKGHCRFDISAEGSEFADFYDSSADEEDSEDDDDDDKTAKNAAESSVQLDSTSLRLPSGKVLSHRSSPQPRFHRPLQRPREDDSEKPSILPSRTPDPSPADPTTKSTALTRAEKRDNAFTTALSRLSASDRSALMHLPAAEQRSIIATQKRQVEKAGRAQRRYRSRLEGMGNRFLQEHFVEDVRNGKLMQY